MRRHRWTWRFSRECGVTATGLCLLEAEHELGAMNVLPARSCDVLGPSRNLGPRLNAPAAVLFVFLAFSKSTFWQLDLDICPANGIEDTHEIAYWQVSTLVRLLPVT